jgi:hypothetical protein
MRSAASSWCDASGGYPLAIPSAYRHWVPGSSAKVLRETGPTALPPLEDRVDRPLQTRERCAEAPPFGGVAGSKGKPFRCRLTSALGYPTTQVGLRQADCGPSRSIASPPGPRPNGSASTSSAGSPGATGGRARPGSARRPSPGWRTSG